MELNNQIKRTQVLQHSKVGIIYSIILTISLVMLICTFLYTLFYINLFNLTQLDIFRVYDRTESPCQVFLIYIDFNKVIIINYITIEQYNILIFILKSFVINVLLNFQFRNVKERVQLLEKLAKEREAEQLNKISKSTQINKVQKEQILIQNQQEQREQDQTQKENDVINTLNDMFNQNPQVGEKSEVQQQKESQMSAQHDDELDEEIEKNEELCVNDLIQKVNEKELQSEDRIYVSIITSELTTEIQRSQRQSMDLQQINLQDRSQSVLKSKFCIDNSNQIILVSDDQYYLDSIEKIIFIQRFIKQKLEKEKKDRIEKEQQFIEKMNRYRINVLNELIQTEIKYVADLEILKMMKYLLIEKFPNKEDEIKMMFNIHDILKFNTEFLKELRRNNYLQDPNSMVMQNIVPLLNGFIFYYEYCKAYDQARKCLNQFEVQPVYQQFLKDIKLQDLLKGLALNDYTIKPAQRLPKYVLLFKDLLKHTIPSHPDYQNVKFCLETIEKINDKNNYEMDVYLKQAKLTELYQQFGNIKNLQIFEPNIYFIFEDICSIYTKKIEQRIIIYAFNNLLLFAKIDKQNIIRYKLHIPITYQSYIKDLKDLVILKNSFEFINRNEAVVIVNGDNKQKQSFINKIQLIINQQIQLFQSKIDKKQDNNICIKVVILGITKNKNQNKNKNTIFYQTQLSIDDITIKCLIRFNQIRNLLQIVNKYDNKLKIPTMNKSISSKNQKEIDERRLRIEQLLQIVLNSPQIIENNEYQKQVLELLNIDSKLYSLPEQKGQKPDLFQNKAKFKQNSNYKDKSLELLQQFQQQTYTQIINMDDQQVKIGNEAVSQPYCIEILLLTGQTLQVGFKKNTITWFIKNAIANHINLRNFFDFKIFIIDTGGINRVIEDGEKISAFLDKSKPGILKVIQKMFHNGTKFQFIFRKYLYLPWKQEELEYKQDEVRLKYLMYEIIFLAKNLTFPLSFIDFCLMTAFYSIATQQKIDKHLLKKVLPSSIIKSHPEKLWLEQIQKEATSREKQLLEFSKQSQSAEKNKTNSSIQSLSNLLMVTCFQTNILFGMQLFFVECAKETIQIVNQKEFGFGFKLNSHVLIGLNYNGLHFIKPENRASLGRIDYSQITETKSFPIEFTCKINNQNLKFKTQTPFEIKHLILEYQQIIEFLNS